MKHLRNKISFFFFSTMLALLYGVNASAQTGVRDATSGVKAFNDAATGLTAYFEPLTVLVYVVGAIVGLIGAIKVYQKFSSGDPDTGKVAASWFGACIFLIVSATVLRAFFLD